MFQSTLSLPEPQLVLTVFGTRDQYLKEIRQQFGVTITHRDGEIRVAGPEEGVHRATRALEQLKSIVEHRGQLESSDVAQVLAQVNGKRVPEQTEIDVMNAGRTIAARTDGQAKYVRAVRNHDLTFAVGPAGSGKTYLAVALAIEAFKQQMIRKIVLVRPAVEAGESLGFLPGDLQAKIHPYLRPLMDALHEMVDYDQLQTYIQQDVVEVVPLAYMRGRTLNEAFIILDEAQNTTISQMKMFLTRMGEQSKIVVSGDTTQVDLAHGVKSGLVDALTRLERIPGVASVRLTKADIVRHRLVQDIVQAYDTLDQAPRRKKRGRDSARANSGRSGSGSAKSSGADSGRGRDSDHRDVDERRGNRGTRRR